MRTAGDIPMNAVTSNRALPAPPYTTGLVAGLRESADTSLKFWAGLAILTTFWVYVTASNVLYATSMQASLASKAPGRLFAPWDQRVLQHLFLYPFLLLCVLGSLRIGWQPMWRALPAQIGLGLLFSILGSPALVGAEML